MNQATQVFKPLYFLQCHGSIVEQCLFELEQAENKKNTNKNLNLDNFIKLNNCYKQEGLEVNLTESLTRHNSPALNDQLYSLRFRIIATLAGLGSSEYDLENIVIKNLNIPFGHIAYAVVGHYLVIMPPCIDSSGLEEQVLAGVELLFEQYGRNYDWLIDCSALKLFSALTFGNIIYYQEKLMQNRNALLIFWLRESILPEPQLKVLARVLNLKKVGNQYFSDFR